MHPSSSTLSTKMDVPSIIENKEERGAGQDLPALFATCQNAKESVANSIPIKSLCILTLHVLPATILPLCHKIDSLNWFQKAMKKALGKTTCTIQPIIIRQKKTQVRSTPQRNLTRLLRSTQSTFKKSKQTSASDYCELCSRFLLLP